MVTLNTIAKKAGVAPSTVSRVLRGDETCYISEIKKQRILDISKELNYSPNIAARNLATRKTRNIAYVLCMFSHLPMADEHPWHTMLDEIQMAFKKAGYMFSIAMIEHGNLKELKVLCDSKHMYDGLIFARGVIPSEGAAIVEKTSVPAIVVDDNRPWLKNIPKVATNKVHGISQVISHLVGLGHEKIACYGFGDTFRYNYFTRAMKENGLKVKDDLMIKLDIRGKHYEVLDAYLQAERVIEKRKDFSAVFCTNDNIALGLCQKFRECGIQVGEDVFVAGFDNIEQFLVPQEDDRFLTTVYKPAKEMGRRAAELLLDGVKADGTFALLETIIPCRLIVRASTGRQAPDHSS